MKQRYYEPDNLSNTNFSEQDSFKILFRELQISGLAASHQIVKLLSFSLCFCFICQTLLIISLKSGRSYSSAPMTSILSLTKRVATMANLLEPKDGSIPILTLQSGKTDGGCTQFFDNSRQLQERRHFLSFQDIFLQTPNTYKGFPTIITQWVVGKQLQIVSTEQNVITSLLLATSILSHIDSDIRNRSSIDFCFATEMKYSISSLSLKLQGITTGAVTRLYL